jgi:hypothetical protein
MDTREARKLLQEQLGTYRQLSYAALAARVGTEDHLEAVGFSGVTYQIEIMFLWDHLPGGDVRVLGAVDDMGLRAIFPLCDDFLVAPNGSTVGE